jgi:hypothetical protein
MLLHPSQRSYLTNYMVLTNARSLYGTFFCNSRPIKKQAIIKSSQRSGCYKSNFRDVAQEIPQDPWSKLPNECHCIVPDLDNQYGYRFRTYILRCNGRPGAGLRLGVSIQENRWRESYPV